MEFERVKDVVSGHPHMTTDQARRITEHILQHRPSNVLELGFRHGVSSCYIAAALDEVGDGRLTTVDLVGARKADPNVDTLLEKIGLRDLVTVFYEPISYTWRLMKMLEERPLPSFELIYLDGAHTWDVDGLAFFLADRLLADGGWIVLDDLPWSYKRSPSWRDSDRVAAMTTEEAECQQVRKIYELLIKTHPSYGEFRDEGDWAFARKVRLDEAPEIVVERIVEKAGVGEFLLKAARRIRGTG